MSFGLICVGRHVTPPDRTAGSPIEEIRACTHCACNARASSAVRRSGCSSTDVGTPPLAAKLVAYRLKISAAISFDWPASNGP